MKPRNRLESPFDSTLGYPGEGPPRRNLQRTYLDPQYRRVLQKAWHRLSDFCQDTRGTPLKDALGTAREANKFLISYIQRAYDSHKPISHATHAILAVQHRRRSLKGQLRRAWDSVASWRQEVKVQSRLPMPRPVFEAVVGHGLYLAAAAHYQNDHKQAGILYS